MNLFLESKKFGATNQFRELELQLESEYFHTLLTLQNVWSSFSKKFVERERLHGRG